MDRSTSLAGALPPRSSSLESSCLQQDFPVSGLCQGKVDQAGCAQDVGGLTLVDLQHGPSTLSSAIKAPAGISGQAWAEACPNPVVKAQINLTL